MDLHDDETILFEGHPSWRSTLGFYLLGLLVVAVVVAIAAVAGVAAGVAAAIAVAGTAAVLLVGLLRRLGTRYIVTDQRLHIRRGILSRRVQQTQLARVQNVNTSQSLGQRLLRIGAVDFDTAGTDDSDFTMRGVADPDDVVRAVDRALRSASPAV
jgi:uncharacterized membrane protein YdbT with pleckstrin-like domain